MPCMPKPNAVLGQSRFYVRFWQTDGPPIARRGHTAIGWTDSLAVRHTLTKILNLVNETVLKSCLRTRVMLVHALVMEII